ncbi:MAG: S1/P1 Nuclease [Caulobacteraceae bacterium]
MRLRSLLAAAVLTAAPHAVLAWGSTGHRIIGRLAIEALPADLPAFLRSRAAAEAIGELAREPDRWRGAGRIHDADRDPGHFVDVDDAGKVMGGPALASLPITRESYESSLREAGSSAWKAGYLPYSIVDGWQQLAKDFAYWRAAKAGAKLTANPAHRAWLADDATRREELILRDLGVLGHYVGDGSQPLHVSVHFNGWGPGPNPDGFTEDKMHAYFEGEFVRDYVSAEAVRAAMTPYRDCHCPIETRAADYLAMTQGMVTPLYRLWKAGGFENGDARGRAFAAQRLAAGADELRDDVIEAWNASAVADVGWPAVKVADVLAGKTDPFDALYGTD